MFQSTQLDAPSPKISPISHNRFRSLYNVCCYINGTTETTLMKVHNHHNGSLYVNSFHCSRLLAALLFSANVSSLSDILCIRTRQSRKGGEAMSNILRNFHWPLEVPHERVNHIDLPPIVHNRSEETPDGRWSVLSNCRLLQEETGVSSIEENAEPVRSGPRERHNPISAGRTPSDLSSQLHKQSPPVYATSVQIANFSYNNKVLQQTFHSIVVPVFCQAVFFQNFFNMRRFKRGHGNRVLLPNQQTALTQSLSQGSRRLCSQQAHTIIGAYNTNILC